MLHEDAPDLLACLERRIEPRSGGKYNQRSASRPRSPRYSTGGRCAQPRRQRSACPLVSCAGGRGRDAADLGGFRDAEALPMHESHELGEVVGKRRDRRPHVGGEISGHCVTRVSPHDIECREVPSDATPSALRQWRRAPRQSGDAFGCQEVPGTRDHSGADSEQLCQPVSVVGRNVRIVIGAQHRQSVDMLGDRRDIDSVTDEVIEHRQRRQRVGELRHEHECPQRPLAGQGGEMPENSETAKAVSNHDRAGGAGRAQLSRHRMRPRVRTRRLGIRQWRDLRGGDTLAGQSVGAPAEPVVSGRGAVAWKITARLGGWCPRVREERRARSDPANVPDLRAEIDAVSARLDATQAAIAEKRARLCALSARS